MLETFSSVFLRNIEQDNDYETLELIRRSTVSPALHKMIRSAQNNWKKSQTLGVIDDITICVALI